VNPTQTGRVGWSDSLIVIEGTMALEDALPLIKSAPAWVVISRGNGTYLYAFRADELWAWPSLRAVLDNPAALRTHIAEVLDLHEEHRSTTTASRGALPPIDRSWRPNAASPSIERYVEVGPNDAPLAVGTMVLAGHGARRVERSIGRGQKSKPPEATAPLEDEGTSPLRHPSIEIDRPLAPGREIVVTVDLLREADARTQGPVSVGPLATDWDTLDLTVHLQCAALEFVEGTQATVTIHRNAASDPAKLKARVRAGAANGAMVIATFMLGTRFCGSAFRAFDAAQRTTAPPPGTGTVVVEPRAQQPDLTVHISKVDKDRPTRLRWLIVTERFDGLPPRLEEDIELDHDPAAQASALFKEFAVLERGKHMHSIDGFGSRLWAMTPEVFRKVYWVLWERHQRPLIIQFISDEPHIPWELMRPVRSDESEIHPPLALKHAVARWIKRWDGYMRNRLPAGRLCTIAPKYASVSRALKRAQVESDKLVATFSARREDGTREAVLKLLERTPPTEPFAILHFAGHGTFAPEAATHSSIKLEDGELTAAEVERPEVSLGRSCHTLVFFNACEVGAAGAVFGEVGGWADAFLGRQFGGFIAPLWSVDDEDASIVAVELLERILMKGEPIGAALRAVRDAHGATSPTFYSYLYYGDVTACIAAAAHGG
jgi:hypothetical protein